ncbi:MAG: sugar transporter [Sphingobium sp.]
MKAPRVLLIVSIFSLLWNLMGIAAYLGQVTMDTAELAQSKPYQANMFAQMPHWAWAAYAIAVFSGLGGAIFLLMKSSFAVILFLVSLVAVLVQFSYGLLMTDLIVVKGATAAIFPAIIILIALGQFLFARNMVVRGILK